MNVKPIMIPFPKILQEGEVQEEQIDNEDMKDLSHRFEIMDIIHICTPKKQKRKRSYSDSQMEPKRLRFDSL
jgi:hypothetical protein